MPAWVLLILQLLLTEGGQLALRKLLESKGISQVDLDKALQSLKDPPPPLGEKGPIP